MLEALIFDWSGTLADDVGFTHEVTNATLRSFGGSEISLETYQREFKIPVAEFYDRYLPGHTLTEIDDVYFSLYKRGIAEIALFPQATELLRTEHRRGKRLFLLTTVREEIVQYALEVHRLSQFFEGIYAGTWDKRKVLPELIAERGLERDTTLFVGDSVHDLEAGHASRTRVAAALYGYSHADALMALRPDYALESLEDLQRMLDKEHLFDTVPLVIPTVGGVVQDPRGRILLVRTRKWSGLYGLPGGKVDYGETLQMAFAREVREETGLEVYDTRFVTIYDCIESEEFIKPRHFLLINYAARTRHPEPLRPNYELDEALWLRPDEALSMSLNQPTRALLERLIDDGTLIVGGSEHPPE